MSPSPVNEKPMDFMDEDEVVDSPPKPKLDPKMSKNSS